MLVTEQRNYKVTRAAQARDIARGYAGPGYDLGLPEVIDRHHEWKVALKFNGRPVGDLYIDAYTGAVNQSRSTRWEVLLDRRAAATPEPALPKSAAEYAISPLENTVVCADTLVAMDAMPEQSVDLVFTSPPYYNARPQYQEYDSYGDYLAFMGEVFGACARVLADGRFIVVNISHVLVPRASRKEASTRLAVPFDFHRLLTDAGFEFVDDIIWQKPEGAGWATGRGRRFAADRNPLQYKAVPVTEYVLVYRKWSDRLIDWHIRNHPDQEAVRASKIPDGYEKTNVWYMAPARHPRHPAVFPQALAENVIRYYSFKNDVVLDPFAGVGTTGIAAKALGRRYYLIEREAKYIEEFGRED